jgi:Chlamydia polymorphic membrane protein (Chlamydia_PMP) repeat
VIDNRKQVNGTITMVGGKKHMRILSILLFSACFVSSVCGAATLLVPGQITTIRDAITLAEDGDTIEIAPGTYTGPDNINLSFLGKAITICSQSGNAETCIIDCGAVDGNRAFLYNSGEGSDSILKNITITGGYHYSGGAIYLEDIEASLSPAILGCRFIGNQVHWSGGAIAARGELTSPLISDCTFINNSAESGGGAASFVVCEPTVRNCSFTENRSSAGGAVNIATHNSTALFENCFFAGNSSDGGGGAFMSHTSDVYSSQPRVTDCIFTGNLCDSGGGAIRLSGLGTWHFTNCTVAGNIAQIYGGGGIELVDNVDLEISNSIIWGNCSANDGNEIMNYGDECRLDCCDFSLSGLDGSGEFIIETSNIHVDPLFCEPNSCDLAPTTSGSYDLDEASPCAEDADCGLIGAMGVNCGGGSATENATWGSIKSNFRNP